MKYMFYDDWTRRRVTRIINIFGSSWFNNKTILELGAAHGDIGIEFLRLGADVTFSDARIEHLTSITDRLKPFGYIPKCVSINQNKEYNLSKMFDLVLHLGTLYHIENWKQDLQSVMSHTNMMILETIVDPSQGKVPQTNMPHPVYGPYNCKNSHFTQEQVEQHLKDLGCKYVRFDDPSLNSTGWINKDSKDNHWYNWTYENFESMKDEGFNQYRRMWLVIC